MLQESKKLREERVKLVEDSRVILDTALDEKRELTDEEAVKWDEYDKKISSLKAQIDRIEKQHAIEGQLKDKLDEKAEENGNSADEEKNRVDAYSKAFWNYMARGHKETTPEDIKTLQTRAQTTQTDSSGGFLIPQGFSDDLEIALKEFGGMREVSRIFRTATGNNLDWPEMNDTTNTGRWLSENTDATKTDVVFASNSFEAWTASSDEILVPRQLMLDSFFDMQTVIRDAFIDRIGRLTNAAYTTGDGADKPHGVVTDATSGVTTASGIAIAFDELFELKHSVDPAYRKRGAVWMFNDSTLKAISKLKDSDNQYLWQPSNIEGNADTLLGHKVIINQDVASIAVTTKPVLFGDFSKYMIRDVVPFTLLRSDERRIEALQIDFVGFLRTDGRLIDAGTQPVKFMTMGNT